MGSRRSATLQLRTGRLALELRGQPYFLTTFPLNKTFPFLTPPHRSQIILIFLSFNVHLRIFPLQKCFSCLWRRYIKPSLSDDLHLHLMARLGIISYELDFSPFSWGPPADLEGDPLLTESFPRNTLGLAPRMDPRQALVFSPLRWGLI